MLRSAWTRPPTKLCFLRAKICTKRCGLRITNTGTFESRSLTTRGRRGGALYGRKQRANKNAAGTRFGGCRHGELAPGAAQGRDHGGPAAGGGACEDVQSTKYAQRAYFAAYTRGTSSLGARKGATCTRAIIFRTSSSPRPQNGGARAYSNLGQPIVLKDPHFVYTFCCLRVRARIMGAVAQQGRDATGFSWTRSRCSRS